MRGEVRLKFVHFHITICLDQTEAAICISPVSPEIKKSQKLIMAAVWLIVHVNNIISELLTKKSNSFPDQKATTLNHLFLRLLARAAYLLSHHLLKSKSQNQNENQ